jgi:hypothetical protein
LISWGNGWLIERVYHWLRILTKLPLAELNEFKHTWLGDVNLDGPFNADDLVFVFQAGEYDDAAIENSTWETGDWNADAEFTSADLAPRPKPVWGARSPYRMRLCQFTL